MPRTRSLNWFPVIVSGIPENPTEGQVRLEDRRVVCAASLRDRVRERTFWRARPKKPNRVREFFRRRAAILQSAQKSSRAENLDGARRSDRYRLACRPMSWGPQLRACSSAPATGFYRTVIAALGRKTPASTGLREIDAGLSRLLSADGQRPGDGRIPSGVLPA